MSKSSIRFYNGLLLTSRRRAGVKNFSAGVIVEVELGAGEPSIIPVAAAIANAIFDAVGARLREVPFTPKRVLAGLQKA